ncbi:RidA family protein [candidate division KSB1 bacterium]|nr:RidA family protein [candidate division KSB1 bacterium]NIR71160.1 RidA family protein [candidate division KSB1 bacterium]NIS23290.1 RidA family protein [candidate division KSB1 bacterium]NIT70169.1 RidA family protein [candidate division KSB1 bacterium]NIU23820.1 RidA family protein [candidate division KSB1 bacterium]
MSKKIISTNKAPQAIGPYSQAVQAGPLLFVSGQIAIDPATGDLKLGDIQSQTRLIMENIQTILEEAGVSLDSVVKTTIFMKDMSDFAAVNEAYGSYFKKAPPARAAVEVAALPKGVGVEIEAIAFLGE